MSICRIVETGATPEQYDQVTERLGVGESPPPGAELHLAALADKERSASSKSGTRARKPSGSPRGFAAPARRSA